MGGDRLRVEDRTTKVRILDRAYELAGLYGLESLTIGWLANELAMSKARIYGHFGSKQALQLETIRHARSRFLRTSSRRPRQPRTACHGCGRHA